MTLAADLEEGEVGGCERWAVVAPSSQELHSVFNAGLGLAYGPMYLTFAHGLRLGVLVLDK